MARRNRFFGGAGASEARSRGTHSRLAGANALVIACATAGLVLAGAAVAGGCGGSESGGSETTDTGTPDTGVVADTSKPDTTPAETTSETPADTTKEYDAPGSLFDADIPDIVFDGDVTAVGCYDCTTTQCHDQVAECDKDVRCRGTLLCILTTCTSFSDTTCALGCAGEYDVTATDPILGTLLGIGTCVRNKCADSCPALPGGGDATPPPDASPGDGGSGEASSGEAGSADAGSGEVSPMWHAPGAKVIDPVVIDVLRDLQMTFSGMPEVRAGLVDHLQSVGAPKP